MQTLKFFQGASPSAPALVFAHANGYPPESYRALLNPLAGDFRVYTLEHRPFWQEGQAPRSLNWRVYARDLITTLERELDEPVFLVGHSMGAITGMLAALERPAMFRGLVALDPVLLPFGLWLAGRITTQVLRSDIPIAQKALSRPHQFQSHEAAFLFYRSKRPFRRVGDDVLWDYVVSAHREVTGHGVELRWSGAWEACVYRSAPWLFGRLSRLALPMMGVAGDSSDVLTPAALASWQAANPQLELHVLNGGHLIPLEAPEHCAALVGDFLATVASN